VWRSRWRGEQPNRLCLLVLRYWSEASQMSSPTGSTQWSMHSILRRCWSSASNVMHLDFKVANRRSINLVEAIAKDLWEEEQLAYIPCSNLWSILHISSLEVVMMDLQIWGWWHQNPFNHHMPCEDLDREANNKIGCGYWSWDVDLKVEIPAKWVHQLDQHHEACILL